MSGLHRDRYGLLVCAICDQDGHAAQHCDESTTCGDCGARYRETEPECPECGCRVCVGCQEQRPVAVLAGDEAWCRDCSPWAHRVVGGMWMGLLAVSTAGCAGRRVA